MDEKDENDKKRKFTAPEQIKFAKQSAPKPLPGSEEQSKVTPPAPIQKSTKLNIDLKSPKPEKSTLSPNKLTLRPEDIKIKLSTKIEQLKKANKPITIKPKVETFPTKDEIQENAVVDGLQPVEPKIEPIQFHEHEENITDLIESYGEFNFSRELQVLIIKNGSTLSDKLCEQFISNMLEEIETALKYEDLKLAAEIFIKIEKSL